MKYVTCTGSVTASGALQLLAACTAHGIVGEADSYLHLVRFLISRLFFVNVV